MSCTTTILTGNAIKTVKPKKRDDGKLENNKLTDGRGLYWLHLVVRKYGVFIN